MLRPKLWQHLWGGRAGRERLWVQELLMIQWQWTLPQQCFLPYVRSGKPNDKFCVSSAKKKKNKGENMFILTSENYRHQTLSHCLFFFFGFIFCFYWTLFKAQSSNNSKCSVSQWIPLTKRLKFKYEQKSM